MIQMLFFIIILFPHLLTQSFYHPPFQSLTCSLCQMITRTAASLLKSTEPHVWLLLKDALARPSAYYAEAVAAVVAAVAEDTSLLDQSASHRVLKDLCHSGANDHLFAQELAKALAGRLASLAASNRSAFVVLGMLESCPSVGDAIRAELTPEIKSLSALDSAGCKLLVKVSCVCVCVCVVCCCYCCCVRGCVLQLCFTISLLLNHCPGSDWCCCTASCAHQEAHRSSASPCTPCHCLRSCCD